MTELQKTLLRTFEAFKKICDDNNLQYFAYAGTALGAIRHSGFIPWDDDIDIVMPLPDYYNFRTILQKKEMVHFGLYNGLEKATSDMAFMRLYDKNTTFTSNDLILDPGSYIGVYIDIFPLVGAPEDSENRHKFVDNLHTTLSDLRIKKLFNIGDDIDSLKDRYMALCTEYPFEKSAWVCVADRITLEGQRAVFTKSSFGAGKQVPFESTTITIASNYDEQLTKHFGDYMTLPPESERRTHESFAFVDLETPVDYYKDLFLKSSKSSNLLHHIASYASSVRAEKEDILTRIPPLEERIRRDNIEIQSLQRQSSQPSIKDSLVLLLKSIKNRLR